MLKVADKFVMSKCKSARSHSKEEDINLVQGLISETKNKAWILLRGQQDEQDSDLGFMNSRIENFTNNVISP